MKTWTNVDDKSAWGDGAWQHEPDKAQWVDEATGLDCLAVRNGGGAWCGYVGVAEGHPFFGVDYDNARPKCSCENLDEQWHYCDASYLSVHGGLTFADFCHEPTEHEWMRVEEMANDPRLIDEARRYPSGDAAKRMAALREQRGLTFAEWQEYQQARRICHVPQPGRPARVWWLGFDCAHAGDRTPAYESLTRGLGFSRDRGDEYRTLDYARAECASLARQLAAVAASTADGAT